MEIVAEKRCRKCGIVKSVDNFSRRNDKYGDGFQRQCRQCDKAYRQANKERIRQRVNEYNARNRNVVRQRHRRYAEEHRERIRENNKQWRTENAERLKQYKKEHRARDLQREQLRRKEHPWRNRLKIAARRARKDGVPTTLTEKEWLAILAKYGNRCLKCGSVEELEIDHVLPLSKGGPNSAYNVQPLCTGCNSSKLNTYADYRPVEDQTTSASLAELGRQINLAESSRSLPGIKNPKAKLNERDIIEIRSSGLPSRVLAKKFHVGVWTINDIKARRTWRHIKAISSAA